MKFAVGYQPSSLAGNDLPAILEEVKDQVTEVYFPWVGTPSGRSPLGVGVGGFDWAAQEVLEHDLAAIKQLGIQLDLLLNANCYGGRALSCELADEVISILARLRGLDLMPEIVTTASPLIAQIIKTEFPSIRMRASVNMRIESVEAMSYVADLFDGFYLRRDRQRNLNYVRSVSHWCKENGKELGMLANSGCLYECPWQSFHDNLVAHEKEIFACRNVEWEPYLCRQLFRNADRRAAIMKCSWIRPEDLSYYEGLVNVVKLATRMHANPKLVLTAYTERHYSGDLLMLLEPGHIEAFAGYYLDNSRFPNDWFEHTSTCVRNCENCDYCQFAYGQVTVNQI